METYWIFEGGGAKGIGHVGAYAFFEKHKLSRPKGVAGTSAGAIVAALIAAGYSWNEIFDPADTNGGGIFNMKSTTREFGFYWKWWLIVLARFIGRVPQRWYMIPIRWPLVFVFLASFLCLSGFGKGLFKTDQFAVWLNAKLLDGVNRHKAGNQQISGPVRFADLQIPLSVVATNLSRRELTVFDAKSAVAGSELYVAQAVAASIAIPFLFRPVRLGLASDLYVDGGVTSNFPVWMFESVREDFGRTTPVIGVQLLDQAPVSNLGKTFNYISTVISTAITGAQKIEAQRIKNLNLIQVPTKVGTLDFDMSATTKAALYQEGYSAAATLFKAKPQLADPALTTRYLDELEKKLKPLLNNPKHLRVNVILPVSDSQLMVYFTSTSMKTDTDTDDCLLFGNTQGATGQCLSKKRPVHCDLSQVQNRVPGALELNKYQQSLVRKSLNSLLCMPILRLKAGRTVRQLDDLDVIGTVNIDSDEDLNQTFSTDAFQRECLALIATYIEPVLSGDELE